MWCSTPGNQPASRLTIPDSNGRCRALQVIKRHRTDQHTSALMDGMQCLSTAVEIGMESSIGGVRGLSAKQIAYTKIQIPKVYYSAVSILVNLYMVCLSFEGAHDFLLAANESCDSIVLEKWELNRGYGDGSDCPMRMAWCAVGQVIIIFVFCALLVAAMQMAECFGSLYHHYDLGVDLDALWQESKNVLRAMEQEPPRAVRGHKEKPLGCEE